MVVGVTMVKDEIDIIEATMEHMLRQVDHVLVADNGSVDGTREVLESLPVTLKDDPQPGYYQSAKMTALAHEAGEMGATWIVPFDADEVHLAYEGRLAPRLAELGSEVMVCEAPLFDHMATAEDPLEGSPLERMGWRRTEQLPLRKVSFRFRPGIVIHAGNHGITFPDTPHPPAVTSFAQVRHFPYRSPEQMIRKVRNGAAAYAATDLPESIGAHWRGYGEMSDEGIESWFREHFWSADPRADGLVYNPVPRLDAFAVC